MPGETGLVVESVQAEAERSHHRPQPRGAPSGTGPTRLRQRAAVSSAGRRDVSVTVTVMESSQRLRARSLRRRREIKVIMPPVAIVSRQRNGLATNHAGESEGPLAAAAGGGGTAATGGKPYLSAPFRVGFPSWSSPRGSSAPLNGDAASCAGEGAREVAATKTISGFDGNEVMCGNGGKYAKKARAKRARGAREASLSRTRPGLPARQAPDPAAACGAREGAPHWRRGALHAAQVVLLHDPEGLRGPLGGREDGGLLRLRWGRSEGGYEAWGGELRGAVSGAAGRVTNAASCESRESSLRERPRAAGCAYWGVYSHKAQVRPLGSGKQAVRRLGGLYRRLVRMAAP